MDMLRRTVIDIFGDRNTDFLEGNSDDIIINLFKGKTRGTMGRNVIPPGPDRGIEMMNEAIEKVAAQAGGKRKKIRFCTKKNRAKRIRVKTRVRKN